MKEICCHCKYYDNSKSYCNVWKEKEQGNDTCNRFTNAISIDWEQRRYEIAKAAMVGKLASPVVEGIDPNPSIKDVAKWSVMLADALIEGLKKE